MAKKKVIKKAQVDTRFQDTLEDAAICGTQLAENSVNRIPPSKKRNSGSYNTAIEVLIQKGKERKEVAEEKEMRLKTLATAYDVKFWETYIHTLYQFLDHDYKTKTKKADTTRQLSDFFANDSAYKKGLNAIKNVLLDKHGNLKRGKLNNIATTFYYFNTKGLLKKGSEPFPFSNALARHFDNSISTGGIGKGAYTEQIAIELENYLKVK